MSLAGLLLLVALPSDASVPDPVALALDIAEIVAPLTDRLHVEVDDTLPPAEEEQIRSAFAKTGLFQMGPHPNAIVVVLGRIDDQWVHVKILRPDGSRLRLMEIAMPSKDAVPRPPPLRRGPRRPEAIDLDEVDPAPMSEELYGKLSRFERSRLSIRAVERRVWRTPTIVGFGFYGSGPRFGGGWGMGFNAAPTMDTVGRDWAIVQGRRKVLDELEFAKVVRDHALVKEIKEQRFRRRLYWGLGFGAGAVAGIASGVVLMAAGESGSDRRTVGSSLVTLGIVSGVLAVMFPAVARAPIQDVDDAQLRVDEYNESLRDELDLTPDDLRRLQP